MHGHVKAAFSLEFIKVLMSPFKWCGVVTLGGFGTVRGGGGSSSGRGVCALSWFCRACSWAVSTWTWSCSDIGWCSGLKLKSSPPVRVRPKAEPSDRRTGVDPRDRVPIVGLDL